MSVTESPSPREAAASTDVEASSEAVDAADVPRAPDPAGDRRPWWRRHLGLGLGLVAAVVFVVGTIGPPLFGRGVFLASDFVNLSYPWRSVAEPAALHGEYLTWNPWVAGGSPLAPATSGVMSPFALVFAVLPVWLAPAIQKL